MSWGLRPCECFPFMPRLRGDLAVIASRCGGTQARFQNPASNDDLFSKPRQGSG